MIPLLDGYRVVDLTDGYGALASRVFAELGAEVLRIEFEGNESGRKRSPMAANGTSLHHTYRNAGKQILHVGETDASVHDQITKILSGADVVFVPGDHDRFRGTLDELGKRHPHLVIVSLTPFGLTGPASGWTATELVAQAMGGVVYRSGVPELPPVSAPGSFAEDVGALTGAMAAVIALFQRGPEGRGQVIDLSTVLALAQCTDMSLPLWSLLGMDQQRSGAGMYPLFECVDGLARIVLPMKPSDWKALIGWLGSPPEWIGAGWDEPMLGPDERLLVLAKLAQRFGAVTREEITVDGEAAGVRVTPVLTPAEILVNEHVIQRETFSKFTLGVLGQGELMAGFFGVDGVRAAVDEPACFGDEIPNWPARLTPSPAIESGRPLEGVRVLEIGSGVAAPEAGRIFADWGAEVIKVETRSHPDFQRMVMGGEMNPAFATVNRGKLSFGAELAHPDGRDLVRSLLPHVDVIFENNATGVLERLGLGWDEITQINPRIVLVDSQLYGNRGPWALRKGYGPSARAVGGLTWMWAHGSDDPRGVQTIHPDHLAGRLCALGAVAGLLRRDRIDVGSRIDVAQFEAVIGLLGDQLLAESLEAGAAVPVGNMSAEHVPWNLYRCADEGGVESWLAVCVTDDRQWLELCAIAGDGLVVEERWANEATRVLERVAIDKAVANWLRLSDAEMMESTLQSSGVSAGRALHPRLQATHPQFVARGYPVQLQQIGSGPLLVEGPCFSGSGLGEPLCNPAPGIGEHSSEICQRILGLEKPAIAVLEGAGALDAEKSGA
jgi:crotonobetainyl-CoA:carnitine CoA-transferase CaiB-like acyl-CoA transferase